MHFSRSFGRFRMPISYQLAAMSFINLIFRFHFSTIAYWLSTSLVDVIDFYERLVIHLPQLAMNFNHFKAFCVQNVNSCANCALGSLFLFIYFFVTNFMITNVDNIYDLFTVATQRVGYIKHQVKPGQLGMCASVIWKKMAPGCAMGKMESFCWDTLGPGSHVNVPLTHSTYKSNAAGRNTLFKRYSLVSVPS